MRGQWRRVVKLPRQAESAGAARRLVREALARWEMEGLAEDGAVVVTELVANTVHHTRCRSIQVTVARIGVHRIRLTVRDTSCAVPRIRRTGGAEVRGAGRGLALVEALAVRWGTDLHAEGKSVWAELDAAPSSDPASDPAGVPQSDPAGTVRAYGQRGTAHGARGLRGAGRQGRGDG